ncbi:Hypothetical protein POVR2_LOCUS181 [uncultured virus]|nr:Hypothetical protein POVR2_LOCUS181 [uncultured virus]
MQNQDVLRLIAVHLDDKSLLKLAYSPYWQEVKLLLADNYFWYQRACYVTEMELSYNSEYSWRRVYLSILASDEGQADIVSLLGLDYLPSFLVLEQWKGPAQFEHTTQHNILSSIRDVNLLDFLIESGRLEVDPLDAVKPLRYAAKRGDTEVAEELLAIAYEMDSYSWRDHRPSIIKAAKNAIVSHSNQLAKSIIRALELDIVVTAKEVRKELIVAAIDSENLDIIILLLSQMHVTTVATNEAYGTIRWLLLLDPPRRLPC